MNCPGDFVLVAFPDMSGFSSLESRAQDAEVSITTWS